MKPRTAILSLCALAIAASLALWLGTGREGFTRWPNQKLEDADARPAEGESDLLAEIGFADDDAPARVPAIESRFAFGLLPSGLDIAHLASVASVSGAALAVMAALALRRAAQRPGH